MLIEARAVAENGLYFGPGFKNPCCEKRRLMDAVTRQAGGQAKLDTPPIHSHVVRRSTGQRVAGHVFKGRDVLAFGYAMDFGKAKEDLRLLLEEAKDIFNDEMIKQVPTQAMKAGLEKLSEVAKISTPQQYHTWYSRILPFMRQLGPDRFPEFVGLYEPDPKRKNADWLHYTLQDYMRGTTHSSFDRVSAFSSLFQQQIMIVEAVYWTADQRTQ